MISSSMKHSRSAQRRPCRSLISRLLGGSAPLDQGGLEPTGDRQTQLALVAGVDIDQTLELGRDGAGIDDFGVAREA